MWGLGLPFGGPLLPDCILRLSALKTECMRLMVFRSCDFVWAITNMDQQSATSTVMLTKKRRRGLNPSSFLYIDCVCGCTSAFKKIEVAERVAAYDRISGQRLRVYQPPNASNAMNPALPPARRAMLPADEPVSTVKKDVIPPTAHGRTPPKT